FEGRCLWKRSRRCRGSSFLNTFRDLFCAVSTGDREFKDPSPVWEFRNRRADGFGVLTQGSAALHPGLSSSTAPRPLPGNQPRFPNPICLASPSRFSTRLAGSTNSHMAQQRIPRLPKRRTLLSFAQRATVVFHKLFKGDRRTSEQPRHRIANSRGSPRG